MLEVGVVVEHRQVERFPCGGHEQIGELAATLASRRQQSLHLERTGDMRGARPDGFEGVQRADETVPLVSGDRRRARSPRRRLGVAGV